MDAPLPDVDPALGVAFDRAAGRALAVQVAALAATWKHIFDPRWLERFTLHRTAHGLVIIAAVGAVGLLLGPVVARARSAGGAFGRAAGLGLVGGAVVALAGAPLAHLGSTWAPGITWRNLLVEDAFVGAFIGLFTGLGAAPLAAHHLRIRQVPSLDAVPRTFLAASAALLVPCLVLSVFGGPLRGVPLLAAAIALAVWSARADRRRRGWIERVRAGEVPGFRVDEVTPNAALMALPAFTGEAAGERAMLLRAAEGGGAHPFRAGGPWLPVARLSVEAWRTTIDAQSALRESAITGLGCGLLLLVAIAVPVSMFSFAIRL